MKKGIAIAGNILTDNVKIIDGYPAKNMLCNILSIGRSVGGCVPNTIIDLKKIDDTLPLYAFGKVGNDETGRYVVNEMKKIGINTECVSICDKPTSFTDVMTEKESGNRTFFHNRGANAEFCIEDIDLNKIKADIFHIGYLLLLDKFDESDEVYGTKMAKLLKSVQDRGVKTSIDVVSEDGDRFKRTVIPSLKYCNYVIINEIEAGKVTDIDLSDQNASNFKDNAKKAMEILFSFGVKEKVIIHCEKYGFSLDNKGNFVCVNSFKLPKGYIKGSVGAGDAFCAGSLYGIYNGYDDEKILKFASATACCNLSEKDSVSGMKDAKFIESLENVFIRK